MTLIKSLLLGSAAGVVAVASAQAADLPTRKGPVAAEYVRVCSITVAGAPVVGFVLPGSDTCVKISGYITGQIEGGNIKQGYRYAYDNLAQFTPNAATARARSSVGYTTRYNLTVDAVSNTAYGPLVSHGEIQSEFGSGFDTTGVGTYVNRAYVTWAGLTAGRADSFFSFTGGGLGWANFFSPDQKGFNQPDLLAYTASFGGGFSATISLQMPDNPVGGFAPTGLGSQSGYLGSATQDGTRVPDIVGALDVRQPWGAAHVAGVAHNVRATSIGGASSLDRWGYAIDAGVSFNIPNMAGSVIGLTGAWARDANWFAGLQDAMWGENGAVNGNGQAMAIGDSFYNGGGSWAHNTAWSVSGWANFAVNPTLTLGVEGSIGANRWDNVGAGSPLFNSTTWLVGGVAHYDPVKNLDFEFELLYQDTKNDRPFGYAAGTPWFGNANGFAGRFEVTRSF